MNPGHHDPANGATVSIRIDKNPDGSVRAVVFEDEHVYWNEGHDRCGTCGEPMLPGGEQVGTTYAVQTLAGWEIAGWDGEAFTGWQSGDRWDPCQVDCYVQLSDPR